MLCRDQLLSRRGASLSPGPPVDIVTGLLEAFCRSLPRPQCILPMSGNLLVA